MKKYILSMLVILTLCLTICITAPKAHAATIASGTCGAEGDNLTWVFDDEGTLTISGTGEMADSDMILGPPWYTNGAPIKHVVIEYGVTSVGFNMFAYMEELETVTLADSVTTIETTAFLNCTKLSNITIPESVCSIGDSAFEGTAWYNNQPDGLVYAGKVAYKYKGSCPANVTIKEGTIGIAGGAFCECTELVSVTIPDSVTIIGGYAFQYCSNLTTVQIPNSVTSIKYGTFEGCTALKSITIPASVTVLGGAAFSDCTGLTVVTIPGNVTQIEEFAFARCANLITVNIPDSVIAVGEYAFDETAWYNNQPDGVVYAGKVAYAYKGTCPETVTLKDGTSGIAGCAFYNCTALRSVTIPDSVKTIGNRAFDCCTGLKAVTIPNGVTTINYAAFSGCTGLASVMIPNSVKTIRSYTFSECTGLTSITIPNGVKTIEMAAFQGCTGLTTVTIPDSVTTVSDMAFADCSGLTSVTLSKGMATIEYSVFNSCTNLTSIVIPNSVTNIEAMAFYGCESLSSITIPESVTTIGWEAFSACTDLNEIIFKGSVPEIGEDAFYGVTATAHYSGLDPTWTETVRQNYGGTITWSAYYPEGIVTGGTCGAEGDNLIWTLDDQGTLTISGTGEMKNWSYNSSAPWYSDRSSVKEVVIGNGVTTIGYRAFAECKSLASITIPDSVTTIGNAAFYICMSLNVVTIPDSVVYIGGSTFLGCTSLEKIIFEGSAPAHNIDASGLCNITTDIYYPAGDETWTLEVREGISTNNRWIKYCPGHSYANITDFDCDLCGELRKATSLQLYVMPTKTLFNLGEQLDLTGGVLLFSHADGAKGKTRITEDLVTGFDSTKVGLQTLTVSFGGLSVTYDVRVQGQLEKLRIETMPAKLYYFPGQPLQLSDLVVMACYKEGVEAPIECGEYTIDEVDMTTSGKKTVTIHYNDLSVSFDIYVHREETQVLDSSTYPESSHYADNLNETKTYTYPGAQSITLVFSAQSATEESFDFLYIYDGNDKLIGIYSGSLANKVVTVYGDTVKLQLVTDELVSDYGYSIAAIRANGAVHDYEKGACTVCGAIDEDYVEIFDIDASRMVLGNALEFQFGISVSKIPDTAGMYAIIEKTWADGTTTQKIIPSEEWGTVGPYWAIVYDGLAAKEMNNTFYVTIYNKKDQAISNPKEDSVRAYVERNYATQSDICKTLMVDMLNYGTAAQLNFNYGTNNLANSSLTAEQLATGTTQAAPVANNQFKGTNFMGTRLVLESRIQMQMAFNNMTSDMYAIYSFTDKSGEVKNIRVEGADFIEVSGIKGIELNELVYADARAQVSVIVYNANGSIYAMAADSIESYIARNSNGTDVLAALIKFSDSARAYLT